MLNISIVRKCHYPDGSNFLGTDHYFLSEGYLFHKRNCSQAVVAEKNCLLQGYELKKIVYKAKGNFLEYMDISKLWHKLD